MQTPAVASRTELAEARDTRMAGHIREASDVTGVPFEYLLAQANQESRLNPDARSARSSAMGLYQFTAGTWLDMIKNHGAEHGLGKYADAITKNSDGRWTVADKAMKKEILDLRRDPKVSSLMAGEYAKENEAYLERKLGREVSAQDLYLAHFLGAGGALRVLKGMQETPKAEAAEHLPEAADANPEMFTHAESGQSKSLAQLYKTVLSRFQHAMNDVNAVARRERPQIDLAALKPPARQPEMPPEPAEPLIEAFTAPPPVHTASADTNRMFPVALPPPVSGTKTDGPMLRILLDNQGKKA
ncbi:conserved hypothetical protein [Magnetospirillum sp. LM-5]|uniref:transglycosylase SLT domain-containing protein n=1 Tax=Magnetospirillum sp. LM-5 TaxID=2681466 RepID=UPI001385EB1C|nr:transglycosylase SLT domain-containing protein [Magnetospirillum sp. LM-5]CAA7621536.1 conserved hypothetical protein [Magnetospirillum sp. LM-5]